MKQKHYSLLYRLLHWSIALVIILILGTVFLRMTWFSTDSLKPIIQESITKSGQTLSEQQTKDLIRAIREPMWQWHGYLGFILTILLIIRIIAGITKQVVFPNPFEKGLSRKEQFQQWVYIVFYVGLLITIITGIMLEKSPKSIAKSIEPIHESALLLFGAFIILHIIGLIVAEFTDDKGIISRIINGGKK